MSAEAIPQESPKIDTAIRMYGDGVLRAPTMPVERFDSALEDLGRALELATAQADGFAVCAPQIGISVSVFWFRVGADEGLVVNPTLSDGQGTWMFKEGCLSFPGRFWWIDRPAKVTMTYFDVKGDKHERTDTHLVGRLWQHEVDHLKGRLVIDRLTKSHRKKFEREMAANG